VIKIEECHERSIMAITAASIMAIDDVSGVFFLQIYNKNNDACDMAVKGTH
jgi:hypothetical protein